MLRPIWQRPEPAEVGHLANLEDLRNQLAQRLATLLVGISGLMMWLSLPRNPFSIPAFVWFGLHLGLGVTVLALADTRPKPARQLLVWGLTANLLLGMGLFEEPWLPFIGLLLIFIDTMLLSGSELATAGIILTLAAWLSWRGGRAYPLLDLTVATALAVAVAWLAVSTLYTSLQWTRRMQQRADQLLEEVRNHRAEFDNRAQWRPVLPETRFPGGYKRGFKSRCGGRGDIRQNRRKPLFRKRISNH